MGGGIIYGRFLTFDQSGVEIVRSDAIGESEIIVEIAGEVVAPGIYKFMTGARVEDVLNKAGGFTEEANLEWVERTMNRASLLIDGQKIFVPNQTGSESAKNSGREYSDGEVVLGTVSKTININTASASELEELWGIGPATAQNLIEQRPYSTPEELLSRKILKSNVYERNKDFLSVY